MDHLYVGVKHFWISLNVTLGYMEISMDSFGREFLNKSQYYQMRYMEISMDTLNKNIFELVSMLEGTWKFPWTLLVKHFLIILVSMTLQDTWKFPWTLSVKNFWYSLKINVTSYVEISMDHLGKNIFEFKSQCYRIQGNFHGLFQYRISELVSVLLGTWKFPWTH